MSGWRCEQADEDGKLPALLEGVCFMVLSVVFMAVLMGMTAGAGISLGLSPHSLLAQSLMPIAAHLGVFAAFGCTIEWSHRRSERDWRIHLRALAKLKQGWQDGEGEPLSAEGGRWVMEVLAPMLDILPSGALRLTKEGHLSLHWALGTWRPSLEIDLCARSGKFTTCSVGLDLANALATSESASVDLSTLAGRAEVVRLVLRDMTRSRKAGGP